DSGIYQDCDVPPHYDPILSKLITWAETRQMSITRMSNALKNYIILGIKTNIGFLKRIMDTKEFINGNYHTHFIDENESDLIIKHEKIHNALIAAALIGLEKKSRPREGITGFSRTETTPWQELGHWEICKH
ncbi:acetyl-CoA carboxylase biotin carboxylase subunit, partial [candidate division WOR-3 bacterium]|nr:acetyl-CoA carboxylase biotin carboxylase subunit [candidate division WOR-3 bacterium]